MSQYFFNGIELPNVTGVAAPIPVRVARADTPMRHGGYVGRRFLATRSINVQGVFLPTVGQTFEEMELSYAGFSTSLVAAGLARLFLRRNWFYTAIIENVNESERNIGSIEYDIQFYLADPRQYKLGTDPLGANDTLTTQLITFGSLFTVAGAIRTPIELRLTAAPGHAATLVMTPNYSSPVSIGAPLTWTPAADGLVTVDMENQRAYRGATDVTSEFDGNFFDITPLSAMTITGTGTTGMSMELSYREALL